MDGARDTNGRLSQVHTVFLLGSLTERDHLEEIGVDDRIILNGSSRSGVRRHGLD
jgi:hypothetical protein